MLDCLEALKHMRNIEPMSDQEIKSHYRIRLPKTNKKKLAIFDMDETLIHSVDDIHKEKCEVIVPINFDG